MDIIDTIVQRVLDIVMPKVVEMISTSGAISREGIIVKGTYDPTDGTASILLGDTAAVFTDEGDTPIVIPRVPLHTHCIGDQRGPLGDERVKLIATQSGYAAVIVHGPDDSPGALPGQQIIGAYSTLITIGAKSLNATNDAAMRAANTQTAINAVIAHVQTAINAGFAGCQPGTGVTAPTIASVTATGSTKVLLSN